MNNLLKLTKINVLSFFNLHKIVNAKNSNELKKGIGKVLFILAGLFIFGFYIYMLAEELMKGFVLLKAPHILLSMFMAITSIFLLFTSIYKINGVLFGFKDYNLLFSLPIKKSTIISSKLITLYLSNMIYTLLFMIPAFIVYIKNISVGIPFYLLFIITTLIIPLVPIIVATIIGSILTGISSKFRFKNIFNLILMLIFFVGVMYLSSSMEKASSIDMANVGKSIVNIFNNFYPLTNCYTDIMQNNSLLSLLIFIVVPVTLFIVFILVINKFYTSINNNLQRTYTDKKYKYKNSNTSSPLIALYKKELKRYFSSINYVMNTAIGAILLTLATIVLVIFGADKVNELLDIGNVSGMFLKTGPIMLGAFCALNCSTHSSISLEGKNLWIIKSIPVSPMKIFISKIMVNLTILIPTILINATILALYLKTSFVTYLFLLITPLMYSLFISLVGIILNLYFPNFTWTNEIRVIKQSLPSFLSILIGMLLAIIPLSIETTMNTTIYILLITLIVFILNIMLYLFLKVIGNKKFLSL